MVASQMKNSLFSLRKKIFRFASAGVEIEIFLYYTAGKMDFEISCSVGRFTVP